MAEIKKELNPIEKDPRYIKLVTAYKCKHSSTMPNDHLRQATGEQGSQCWSYSYRLLVSRQFQLRSVG